MRLVRTAAWLCAALLRPAAASLPHELRSLDSLGHVSASRALETPPGTETTEKADDLLAWASRVEQRGADLNPQHRDADNSSVFIVVGVKTSVLHNFALRQAIRQTWGSARPRELRVVFVGCRPDFSAFADAHELQRMRSAVELERQVYGDLLTAELDCVDSYATLVAKTTQFLRWVATTFAPSAPSLAYVVVADDDLFLHVDRLLRLMRAQSTPARRFYGGMRLAAMRPMRDPTHKNYLSHDSYRMRELPQFAAGSAYVLSTDVSTFLARNAERVRGVGDLDDVSVGLWLWATLRINPMLAEGFYQLRGSPCSDDLIALADVSPSAIRFLHRNAMNDSALCDGVASEALSRLHRTIMFPNVAFDDVVIAHPADAVQLKWHIQVDTRARLLSITVRVNVASKFVSFEYSPSAKSHYDGVCVVLTSLLQSKLYITVGPYFCKYHRRVFSTFLQATVREDPPYAALLSLARHNLQHHDSTDHLVVALSPYAMYARWLIECLLVQMGESVRFLVISENALAANQTPDVVVFSILDDGEYNTQTGELAIPAVYRARYGSSAKLVMVSGEAWPVANLDADVLLISTVLKPHRDRFVYVPFASSVFSETTRHTPLELLQAYGGVVDADGDAPVGEERRFGAYLYARCNRPLREYMFDLLNALEPVDALGACQGSSREPIRERLESRYGAGFFFDEAIEMYKRYKFVIAFENAVEPGYVTEKIVSAFLAGSIPIFYGDSASVRRLFNPRAFINCQDDASLAACARRVVEVHRSAELSERMRREPAVTNVTMFAEAFGWHPVVEEWIRSREPGAVVPMGTAAKRLRSHLLEVLPGREFPA